MKILLTLLLFIIATATLQAAEYSPRAHAQAAAWLAYAAIAQAPVDVQAQPEVKPDPKPNEPTPATPVTQYSQALKQYQAEQRPMVVLISASWCEHCPKAKEELERMVRDGELGNATLVILHDDDTASADERRIAQGALGGRASYPTIAVYTHRRGRPITYRTGRVKDVPSLLAR